MKQFKRLIDQVQAKYLQPSYIIFDSMMIMSGCSSTIITTVNKDFLPQRLVLRGRNASECQIQSLSYNGEELLINSPSYWKLTSTPLPLVRLRPGPQLRLQLYANTETICIQAHIVGVVPIW